LVSGQAKGLSREHALSLFSQKKEGEITMKRSRNLAHSVVLVGLLFFMLTDDARAYIDPGSGS